jgi:hypothetical protein
VNFFSHAVVAAWSQSQPIFVLGAMLPDFVTMIGAKRPNVDEPLLLAGIEFHERTDAVFHGTATFRALQRETRATLAAAGVRRGSDRAAAHVGVELLIDAELAHDREAGEIYERALELAVSHRIAEALRWNAAEDARRFVELCTRLRARSGDRVRVDAALVADRVTGALCRRPRLSLDWAAREAVRVWAEQARPELAARMDPLLHELILGLCAVGLTFAQGTMLERRSSPVSA